MKSVKHAILVFFCAVLAGMPVGAMVEYPGAKKPGKAANSMTEDGLGLSNNLIGVSVGYTLNGGLYFGGVEKPGKGNLLAGDGKDEIFTLRLANGKVLKASGMKVTGKDYKELKPNAKAVKKSERLPGKALCATFHAPDGSLLVDWQAELRDGSHYVRQTFTIKALKDVAFEEIIPMQYRVVSGGAPSISGNTTHGTLVVNDEMFMGLETPMSVMRVGGAASAVPEWRADAWSPESFQGVFAVPQSFVDKYGAWCGEKNGPVARHVKVSAGEVNFAKSGKCQVTFR